VTGRRILVVEDDPAFRALVLREFTRWGHDVVGAGTVAEALVVADAERPDTVIADIGLPDGNGFDLTSELLTLTWPMRVIVVSSDHGAGNHQAALQAGAIRFIPKEELFGAAARSLIA
jgi:DNA-binding response OmpR family regulator